MQFSHAAAVYDTVRLNWLPITIDGGWYFWRNNAIKMTLSILNIDDQSYITEYIKLNRKFVLNLILIKQ